MENPPKHSSRDMNTQEITFAAWLEEEPPKLTAYST